MVYNIEACSFVSGEGGGGAPADVHGRAHDHGQVLLTGISFFEIDADF